MTFDGQLDVIEVFLADIVHSKWYQDLPEGYENLTIIILKEHP